jgi:hypothetical protein
LHLEVNVTIDDLVEEVLLCHYPCREHTDGDMHHVFIPVKGRGKVKVLWVEAHVFCLLFAEDAVIMEI